MLADYFSRSALAAAQVLDGFDADQFRSHLAATPVGVSMGTLNGEAASLADLTVRLLARLYPKLHIHACSADDRERLVALASSINPNLEIVTEAELGIVIGDGTPYVKSIFAGSNGWHAMASAASPLPTGQTSNPIGAGVAACLAAAALFRRVFLHEDEEIVERDLRFDAYLGEPVASADLPNPEVPDELGGEAVLAGAGAIGNGALWALARAPTRGVVHVVDHEPIELSNLQRYVLATRQDEHEVKVAVVTRESERLALRPYQRDLATFLAENGYRWPLMLLALDSADDRVAAQASLPGWIANAWTQPGDLGVSSHSAFGGDGACVGCHYLPMGKVKNEDELVAETLAVPHLLMDVRTLLHTGRPLERPLLEAVAQGIGRPLDALLAFEGRPIRELYVEGFCGGAVIPLGEAGPLAPGARDVHVPLAHQSALAGVLLAAALLRHAIAGPPGVTRVTRLNVLRPVGGHLTQPARARRDGRCLCDDADFRAAYVDKYVRTPDATGA